MDLVLRLVRGGGRAAVDSGHPAAAASAVQCERGTVMALQ